ncbi:MAG: hypothetical protein RL616_943 [Verrucomicrobiota bacterium]|jgi:hypothetical protein
MKLKIHFGKAKPFVVANRKIIRGQIPGLPLNWLEIRKLALTERIKSCRRGE